jgi:hypothetical protein
VYRAQQETEEGNPSKACYFFSIVQEMELSDHVLLLANLFYMTQTTWATGFQTR